MRLRDKDRIEAGLQQRLMQVEREGNACIVEHEAKIQCAMDALEEVKARWRNEESAWRAETTALKQVGVLG